MGASSRAAMSCDWEGNRKSGIALAKRHDTDVSGLTIYGLKA